MNHTQQNALNVCIEDALVEVAYAFAPHQQGSTGMNVSHAFLDILFVHPRTSTPVSLRIPVQDHMQCQPKENIEAAVYQEIRNALYFQDSADFFPKTGKA